MRSEPEIDRAPGRRCRVCCGPTEVLLDLGPQPFCNRFQSGEGRPDDAHPLVQGQCAACGTIQLIDPAPVAALAPLFDWIRYKEEGRHLPKAAEVVAGLPGLDARSRICGVTWNDDDALAALAARGYRRTRRLDPDKDLGVKGGGLESFQAALTPEAAREIVRRDGPADLVIARYILEHAHDPVAFLHALVELITPTGYAWIEVPDCTPALETRDYTTLWEEHTLYFTPATFRECLLRNGFSVVRFELYPYTHENSMVALVTPNRAAVPSSARPPQAEWVRGAAFARALPDRRGQWARYCSEARRDNGKLAMFGAGHLACMFINVMKLKDEIAFVVDDHPAKRGLRMPGSGLPILPSAALIDEGVSVCLTSLSPESEEKVIRGQAPFLGRGGRFTSIFPASKLGLQF